MTNFLKGLKIFLYRDHRGSLSDSMKTVRQMLIHIREAIKSLHE